MFVQSEGRLFYPIKHSTLPIGKFPAFIGWKSDLICRHVIVRTPLKFVWEWYIGHRFVIFEVFPSSILDFKVGIDSSGCGDSFWSIERVGKGTGEGWEEFHFEIVHLLMRIFLQSHVHP